MRIRTYSQMLRETSFEDRFDYLCLAGEVGKSTFGFDRWINQEFYRSREWKQVRDEVIARDEGMDLASFGYEIFDKIVIHHMNPMRAEDIEVGDPRILDPNFLITTSHKTHNAIHFGGRSLLRPVLVDRRPGDTKLW